MKPSDHIRHITMAMPREEITYPKISRPKTDKDDIDSDPIEYAIKNLKKKEMKFLAVGIIYDEALKSAVWTLHLDEDTKNNMTIRIVSNESPKKVTNKNHTDRNCMYELR